MGGKRKIVFAFVFVAAVVLISLTNNIIKRPSKRIAGQRAISSPLKTLIQTNPAAPSMARGGSVAPVPKEPGLAARTNSSAIADFSAWLEKVRNSGRVRLEGALLAEGEELAVRR